MVTVVMRTGWSHFFTDLLPSIALVEAVVRDTSLAQVAPNDQLTCISNLEALAYPVPDVSDIV